MPIRFIELTQVASNHHAHTRPVLINPARIVAIEPRHLAGTALPGSIVLVAQSFRFEVREDPGQIRGLLDALV